MPAGAHSAVQTPRREEGGVHNHILHYIRILREHLLLTMTSSAGNVLPTFLCSFSEFLSMTARPSVAQMDLWSQIVQTLQSNKNTSCSRRLGRKMWKGGRTGRETIKMQQGKKPESLEEKLNDSISWGCERWCEWAAGEDCRPVHCVGGISVHHVLYTATRTLHTQYIAQHALRLHIPYIAHYTQLTQYNAH